MSGFPYEKNATKIKTFVESQGMDKSYLKVDKQESFKGIVQIEFTTLKEMNDFISLDYFYEKKLLNCKIPVKKRNIYDLVESLRRPRKVFINRIPKDISKKKIESLLSEFGEIEEQTYVVREKLEYNYSFVVFRSHEGARKIIEKGKITIDSFTSMTVTYSKNKISKSISNEIKNDSIREYILNMLKTDTQNDPIKFNKQYLNAYGDNVVNILRIKSNCFGNQPGDRGMHRRPGAFASKEERIISTKKETKNKNFAEESPKKKNSQDYYPTKLSYNSTEIDIQSPQKEPNTTNEHYYIQEKDNNKSTETRNTQACNTEKIMPNDAYTNYSIPDQQNTNTYDVQSNLNNNHIGNYQPNFDDSKNYQGNNSSIYTHVFQNDNKMKDNNFPMQYYTNYIANNDNCYSYSHNQSYENCNTNPYYNHWIPNAENYQGYYQNNDPSMSFSGNRGNNSNIEYPSQIYNSGQLADNNSEMYDHNFNSYYGMQNDLSNHQYVGNYNMKANTQWQESYYNIPQSSEYQYAQDKDFYNSNQVNQNYCYQNYKNGQEQLYQNSQSFDNQANKQPSNDSNYSTTNLVTESVNQLNVTYPGDHHRENKKSEKNTEDTNYDTYPPNLTR